MARGAKPCPGPERGTADILFQNRQIQVRSGGTAGQIFDVGQKDAAMPKASGAGRQNHQAKIGIARLWKTERKLCEANQSVGIEQAQPVAAGRVASGGRIGEEIRSLLGGIAVTFGHQPVISRNGAKSGHGSLVCFGVQGSDHRTISSNGS